MAPTLPSSRTVVWHAVALACVALLLCLPFISEPGWGDDMEYWSIAFRAHESGFGALAKNFHNLRWPVWGMCWLLQSVIGYNLASFTGAAIMYMAAGAVLCFSFGWAWLKNLRAAWACGIAYLFHPTLDTLCNSPWPDLSEGFWAGGAMLFWWYCMQAETTRRKWLFAVLTGLFVFISQANRLTGVFIVPVLGVCTVLFFPRRFGWLLAAGGVAAALYVGEMAFYHRLHGDWLHNLHSNMNGKGVRGTEPVPLATMPFRFLSKLWGKGVLGPVYSVLAILGCWVAWTRRNRPLEEPIASPRLLLGRVITVWLVVHYLEYACAPQSINPWRPVVREGGRFLGALSVPIAILSVGALLWLLQRPWLARRGWYQKLLAHPLPIAALVCVGLMAAAIPSRPLVKLTFLPAMHAYMAQVPAGTKILTHEQMRCVAFMANHDAATKLTFLKTYSLLHPDHTATRLLPQAQQCWYIRRTIFQQVRWAGEAKPQGMLRQPSIAPQLVGHEAEWETAASFHTQDIPDLCMVRRRAPDAKPATIVEAAALPVAVEGKATPMVLPLEWTREIYGKKPLEFTLTVPESARGSQCRLEYGLASSHAQPLDAVLSIQSASAGMEYDIRPQVYQHAGVDFFTFPLPADTSAAKFTVRFRRDTKWARLERLRLVCDFPVLAMPNQQ